MNKGSSDGLPFLYFMREKMKTIKKYMMMTVLITGLLPQVYAADQVEASATTKFPVISESYLKQVNRYGSEDISRLEQGLNKDQIRFILGNPHFSEGVFASKTWNYVLDVQQPKAQSYLRCQLQIQFNEKNNVEHLFWSSDACANLQAEHAHS